MGNGNDMVQAVVESLLDYVTRHPEAADSIEGIRRWWLPMGMVASAADVEAALNRLVLAGILATRRLPDRGVLYSRRRDR